MSLEQHRLRLPAVLTQSETPAALAALELPESSSGSPAEWRLDASALRDFDSSALALLLACKRKAGAVQAAFIVEGAPPKLVRLAELYGLDELLGVGDSLGGSVAAAVPAERSEVA